MAEDRTVDQEHQISRRRVAEGDTAHAQGGETYQPPQGYSATLLNNPSLGGRGNSGTRAQLLLGAQRTHGNRAVQRAHSTRGTTGRVAIQRSPYREIYETLEKRFGKDNPALEAHKWMLGTEGESAAAPDSEEAGTGRKVRTAASAGVRTARAVTENAAKSYAAGQKDIEAASDYYKVLRGDDPVAKGEAIKKWNEAEAARAAAEAKAEPSKAAHVLNKGPNEGSALAKNMERVTGSKNYFGGGLGLANYGLQFWENMSEGQDFGEAAFGAGAGGLANGQMTKHLFSKPIPGVIPGVPWAAQMPLKSIPGVPMAAQIPTQKTPFMSNKFGAKAGWIDTGVNVLNAGLKLAGAPDEVTTVTQTVADATPSSFGTSLASNAGRGLWNLGDGLINGDWSGMEKQGEDLTHGKEGAPLQGYAVTGEAIYHLASGNSEALDKIREENRSGKRGKLAQLGSWMGRSLRDADDSMKEWTADKWDSAMGRGTKAQRENALYRGAYLQGEHARSEEKERAEKAQLEKEMEGYRASGYAPYNPYQQQQPQTTEDDELPAVSMKL